MSEYWKQRIENIQEQVTMREVVDYFGVPCASEGLETQIHCPFHGVDKHASAKIYETNTMFCWVCDSFWNVITFVRDIKGITFQEACNFVETTFNVSKIDREKIYSEKNKGNKIKRDELINEMI